MVLLLSSGFEVKGQGHKGTRHGQKSLVKYAVFQRRHKASPLTAHCWRLIVAIMICDYGTCTMYRRLECNCPFCDYVRIIYDCIIFQSLAVQSTAD